MNTDLDLLFRNDAEFFVQYQGLGKHHQLFLRTLRLGVLRELLLDAAFRFGALFFKPLHFLLAFLKCNPSQGEAPF
jgi:hypothetical protein